MIRFSREKKSVYHQPHQSVGGCTVELRSDRPPTVSRWRRMVSSRGRPLLPLLPLLSPWDMPRCLRFLPSLLHRIVSSVCCWLLCIPRHWRRCLTSLCLACRCLWSRGRVSLRQTLHRRGPWRMCPGSVWHVPPLWDVIKNHKHTGTPASCNTSELLILSPQWMCRNCKLIITSFPGLVDVVLGLVAVEEYVEDRMQCKNTN